MLLLIHPYFWMQEEYGFCNQAWISVLALPSISLRLWSSYFFKILQSIHLSSQRHKRHSSSQCLFLLLHHSYVVFITCNTLIFKYIIQRFLVNLQNYTVITTVNFYNISITPKRNDTICSHFPTKLFFVSINLPSWDSSFRWIYTICSLVFGFFNLTVFLRMIHVNIMFQDFLLLKSICLFTN